MDRRKRLAGYALVLLGASLFSLKAIFIKLAYREAPDAMLVLVWRMIFSLPFFAATWVYAVANPRQAPAPAHTPKLVLRAVLVGFVGYYLAMIFDFLGLLYVSAQLERLTLFTYPIFVILLGAMFFGSRLTWSDAVSALVTYAGLACVFATDAGTTGSNVWLGTALVLASALSFALYQLLAKQLITAMGSLLFTSVALSSAAVTSILHFVVVRGLPTGVSWHFLALAAATGLFATVIPSYLVNAGMGRIGTQSTAMISTLAPLLTIYLAVVLLGERFGLMDAFGTALVVGGIGNHTWRDLRRPAPQAVESERA